MQDECANGEKDIGESDIDCGGPCTPCALGNSCKINGDCESNNCIRSVCRESGIECLSDADCAYKCEENKCIDLPVEEVEEPLFDHILGELSSAEELAEGLAQ